jgi:UDP-glucose 4-epimerase
MTVDSRRILLTGLSTYWGGRLAQALEAFPEVEAVIGVDNEEPKVELERTEYVKVGAQHALLRRVVEAAEIDTVVDTRLVVDSTTTSSAKAHENNIIGTMNILAACSGADSPVRKVVFKSSAHYYGCEQDDPAFFDETMRRPHPPRTPIERDVVEAEASLNEFAEKNPDVAVTILRFANVLGPSVRTSHIGLFSLPAVPMILGFDPRYQFAHEDDVVHALEHAVKQSVPGVYNVAGDGVLALSEVAGLLGKPYAPIIPFWGTGLAASALRRVGVKIPPEALNQLRFGRGLDNRRYKATGFAYGHTCAAPRSPTATSGTSRTSCAGARTSRTPATRASARSAESSCSSCSGCWPATPGWWTPPTPTGRSACGPPSEPPSGRLSARARPRRPLAGPRPRQRGGRRTSARACRRPRPSSITTTSPPRR